MVKYARLIFEEEVPDDATDDYAFDVVLEAVENYIFSNHRRVRDMEISDEPITQFGENGLTDQEYQKLQAETEMKI